MHALRIGYQGLELLQTGTISLPMVDPVRSHLLEVRAGAPPLSDVLAEVAEVTGACSTPRTTPRCQTSPITR